MAVPIDERATPSQTGQDALAEGSLMSRLAAALHLALWSVRRQGWSRQTIVSACLLLLSCVGAAVWARRRDATVERFTEDLLIRLHASFLLPIFTLCYATAALAGERDERTLVYLLVTPLPRSFTYTAKYAAALVLNLSWSMGAFGALATMAGAAGRTALAEFWAAILWGTLAYTSLFHLFGVLFRRATIIALAYSFFVETFLGHMPGIVKRTSILFYVRCMLYEDGAAYGVGPRFPAVFHPVSGATGWWVLTAATFGLWLAGLIVFCRREYVDAS